MNKQPAVSVIVPVYDAENYLYRCVDSLLAQTFPDFEILLVDDGSPDRSGEICDAYAMKDSRVRVFHKENGGVSSARQCGIDNAQGEYTIHADPDDWVEPDMLEALYKKAKETNADMVICDFYEEFGEKQRYVKQRPLELNNRSIGKDILFQRLHSSLCNKIVLRSCYKKYDVHFPKGQDLCEDMIVMINILRNNLKISYLSRAYYHYDRYSNENSITRDNTKFFSQRKALLPYLKPYLDDPGWIPAYNSLFTLIAIETFALKSCSGKEFRDQYFEQRNILFKSAPIKWKIFIYLAAIGLFKPIRKLYDVLQIMKW